MRIVLTVCLVACLAACQKSSPRGGASSAHGAVDGLFAAVVAKDFDQAQTFLLQKDDCAELQKKWQKPCEQAVAARPSQLRRFHGDFAAGYTVSEGERLDNGLVRFTVSTADGGIKAPVFALERGGKYFAIPTVMPF